LIPKAKWREILLARRKAISKERRTQASLLILEKLKNRGRILSFTPIGSEIDLTPLNQFLSSKNLLTLVPYRIASLIEVPLSNIDCILVPGLGFDRENYRIGYGKGHFDRFLATTGAIPTIGVGFKEQLCEELLPRDPWDIPVKELILI
jgi:5-formyltetrahydrofolate cyclo-ligase